MPHYKPVKALQKGMAVLDYLASQPTGCELNEIAEMLGCSAPAAFHIVQTMLDADYLRREEKPVRYFLGRALQQLGNAVPVSDADTAIVELLKRIHAELPGCSVFFCAYEGGHVQIQKQISGRFDDTLMENLHNMLPPYTSVGSLVHLAFWSDDMREQYCDTYAFETYGSALWGDYQVLQRFLRQARKNSYLYLPTRDKAHVRCGVPLLIQQELRGSLTIQWNQIDRKKVKIKKQELIRTVLRLLKEIWS